MLTSHTPVIPAKAGIQGRVTDLQHGSRASDKPGSRRPQHLATPLGGQAQATLRTGACSRKISGFGVMSVTKK